MGGDCTSELTQYGSAGLLRNSSFCSKLFLMRVMTWSDGERSSEYRLPLLDVSESRCARLDKLPWLLSSSSRLLLLLLMLAACCWFALLLVLGAAVASKRVGRLAVNVGGLMLSMNSLRDVGVPAYELLLFVTDNPAPTPPTPALLQPPPLPLTTEA